MKSRTRRVTDNTEFHTMEIHRQLWRRLCNDEPQTVVTEEQEEPEEIFGKFFPVFNYYMQKGLLKVITIDELEPSEQEFTVIK